MAMAFVCCSYCDVAHRAVTPAGYIDTDRAEREELALAHTGKRRALKSTYTRES